MAISKNIQKPAITIGKIYEVDEIRTFYKCKTRLIWLVYALRKDTKEVADFAIGRRTKNIAKGNWYGIAIRAGKNTN